jgi:hypothetical protein
VVLRKRSIENRNRAARIVPLVLAWNGAFLKRHQRSLACLRDGPDLFVGRQGKPLDFAFPAYSNPTAPAPILR